MTVLRTALWQCNPTPRDVADNLARLDAVAARAAAAGVRLLVTPELALTGYDVGDLDGLLDGTHVGRVQDLARRHGVALVVGLALLDDEGTSRNAAVTVAADGELLETYVKVHLFGDLDASRFASGTRPFGMATVDGVRVATMVCYDVEFPETVRAAALAGADLVAVPTANMQPFTVVSEQVVPVRAWENQTYVGYANHCGTEATTTYVGRSVLVGPDGRAVAAAGPDDEDLVVGDVDTEVVRTARAANPYLTDRRPRLYESLVRTPPPSGEPRT